MLVYLTPEKALKLKQAVTDLFLNCKNPAIRGVAKVVGLIVSRFPGVAYGPLHYCYLGRDKTTALKTSKWNFDGKMCLSSQARDELMRWIDSIESASNPITRGDVDITITSDASKQGWGAATSDSSTVGLWTAEEAKEHVNFLEMLAVLFALKSFRTLTHGIHVKVMVDNTATESTINQMGTSHSPKLNKLTNDIWDWCIEQHIWLTMARIPGCENVEADKESRTFRRCTEWCLKKTLFTNACAKLRVNPNIDLFASRINYQITPYVSYRADPAAFAINAFHLSWQHHLFHAFPPFSLITRVLQKIQEEKATGLLLVAKWPTQPWWPKLMQMLIQAPTSQETVSDSMSLVRRYLNGKGLSTTAAKESWRSGTRKQYATYLQKWRRYCSSRGVDPICPSVEGGINYLAELYDSGIGYSAINTARSVVSSIVTLPKDSSFGSHPMVFPFLKAMFQLKPSLPKYKDIWDVITVMTYLSSLHPPQDVALKDLTYKTAMLLALPSGQRCQTLHLLSVSCMVLKHDSCVFTIRKLLKTSRPRKDVSALTFTAYSPDSRLFPIVCLSEYVKRTSELRKGRYQQLLSFQKPYQPVSTDTIFRWLKTVFAKSGLNRYLGLQRT